MCFYNGFCQCLVELVGKCGAIEGGMDVDEVYRLIDLYNRECEKVSSVEVVKILQYNMVFVSRSVFRNIKRLRISPKKSIPAYNLSKTTRAFPSASMILPGISEKAAHGSLRDFGRNAVSALRSLLRRARFRTQNACSDIQKNHCLKSATISAFPVRLIFRQFLRKIPG